jgi:ribosomal protein L7/L12
MKKNKKTKKVVLDLGVVNGLYEALAEVAALNLRTLNNQAVVILAEALKDVVAKRLYDVVIGDIPSQEQAQAGGFAYVPLIKAIRNMTNLGLKESKDFVDELKGTGRSKVLLAGLTEERVDSIREQINTHAASASPYIKFKSVTVKPTSAK